MIVITHEIYEHHRVLKGGFLEVKVNDKEVFKEEVRKDTTITYCTIFSFAEEDGTVVGENVGVCFAKKEDLPQELKDAVRTKDLSEEQAINFTRTSFLVDAY